MKTEHDITIRPAREGDQTQWCQLWRDYCDFYGESLADEITQNVWAMCMQPGSSISALVAVTPDQAVVGFAHYVLQVNTWSLKPLCYLEDLFVAPEKRGRDIGHALISRLVEMATEHGWRKVYWHTQETNERARRLYDRFSSPDGFIRYSVSP